MDRVQAQATPQSSGSVQMKTILLIEDNTANKILVERVLGAAGYKIIHAEDGETGIQSAIDNVPDLILIDMGLPDIDGQTVLTTLNQLPNFRGIPKVAITAWPAEKAFETADRYGFDGCIVKPIDVPSFADQISRYFKSPH